MITIEADNSDLILRGRNPDRSRWEKRVKFTPYFYIEDEKGEGVGLGGEHLTKIIAAHPSMVPQMRSKYSRTWEADITYVNRYMIDSYPEEIPKEELRLCYLDIETNLQQNGVDAIHPDTPITAICCYDNFLNRYFQFTWHPSKTGEETDTYSLYVCKDEKEMLTKFAAFIYKTDPDLLMAWNGEDFDFPYII